MKFDIISTSRVYPASAPLAQQEAFLPAIDSWYSYARSLVVVFLCRPPQDHTRSSLCLELKASLSRALDNFPVLAGRLRPDSLTVEAQDGRVLQVKRPKLVWGDNNPDGGLEYIEAEVSISLDELLPPTSAEHGRYMWDRSSTPWQKLFPKTPFSATLVRVQVTFLQCGGFAIAIDMDHGIADAHVVGLFMQYWSAIFSKVTSPKLPQIRFRPELADQQVKRHPDPGKMLENASRLAVRRPLPQVQSGSLASAGTAAAPGKESDLVNAMLHFPAKEYNRMAQEIQTNAGVRVTDHVAAASFLWAALNRAQKSCAEGVDLYMPVSLRGILNFPDGTLGSPFVAARFSCDADTAGNAAKLAASIMQTLSQYDENAMRSIAYQATLEDSPEGLRRAQGRAQSMIFTTAVRSGWNAVSFGTNKPVFIAPLFPHNNIFVMVESMSADEEAAGAQHGWYGGGVNIFFKVSAEVFESMLSDTAFSDFAKLCDL